MKYIIALLLVVSPLTEIDKIAKVNKLKKEAKEAYTSGDFQHAIEKYSFLLDSMKVEDPNINLNLANAYYQSQDTTNALNTYQSLLQTNDKVIKSLAHQQLGVMSNKQKKFDEALNHFKNAIKADPSNDEARYNYEMLKKMLDEQDKDKDQDKKDDQKNQDQKNQDQKNQDQQKQDQQQNKEQDQNKENQDQQNKDQQNQDQEKQDQQKENEQQKEGEEGEQKEDKPADENKQDPKKPQEGEESDKKEGKQEDLSSLSEKLKDMKISEEKAKMILEALKNNEIQYIQQNKRKPTKRKDPSKPDW